MSRTPYFIFILFIYCVLSKSDEVIRSEDIEFPSRLIDIELDNYEDIFFKAKYVLY